MFLHQILTQYNHKFLGISCNFKRDLIEIRDYCEGKCNEAGKGPDGFCELETEECQCGNVDNFEYTSDESDLDEEELNEETE